ncbi:hypothetical protein GTA28_22245 [Rhodococcus hoagii]|nr:hypothetical protein [Prescottella equi]
MAKTWPQVRGLNYGTMGRTVRAETWSNGVHTGRVWFQPPTSWRIENASGVATYIENDTDEYRLTDDGTMMHALKSPNRWVMTVGDSPTLLLQAYSMWLPQSQHTPPQLAPTGQPRQVDVRGRTGWEVPFADQYTDRGGNTVTYVIDDELGVALSRSTDTQHQELVDPVIDEAFDPDLFTWTGPTRTHDDPQVSEAQREYEAKMAMLAQMPRPDVTWAPGTIETQPFDGDPRTGALDMHIMPTYATFTLRQWVTELGEPATENPAPQPPLRHHATIGPWTYEIRSYPNIDPADCERIVASITPTALPAAPVDQIRATLDQEAADKAADALTQKLGIGRSLDDYLGAGGDVSLLIRTDFTDDAQWRIAASAAMAPGHGEDSDFSAYLTCIDNPDNDGLSIPDLIERIGDHPPYYVFLADHTTITDPEHPILAVDTGPEEFGHTRGQTVRVIPSQMWSIENNLSISNMDFDEFVESAGPDGVYRGF